MNSVIVVHFDNEVIKVRADKNGTVNENTLRGAFQLEQTIPIGLMRDGVALVRLQSGNEIIYQLEDNWCGADFLLKISNRSRSVTPIEGEPKPKKPRLAENTEEGPESRPLTSTVGGPLSDKPQILDGNDMNRKTEDLAAALSKYALFYTKIDKFKRSAVPLTKTLAATFRHGENKGYKKGDEIILFSYEDEKWRVATRVVKIVEHLDMIIVQSLGGELCDRNLIECSVEPRKGMYYLMMGFSLMYEETNHQSITTGIIASDLKRHLRYTGTSGSYKGDSGASCWDQNGHLMGMQIEVEKVLHTTDNKKRPASPAVGGRCSIIAMRSVEEHIQEFLPVIPDVEWNE